MKIQQHPRMKDIAIGDEVVCYRNNLYARVEEVFPAAVCVRLAVVRNVHGRFALAHYPQLWRAEDIENLSVCRYCGSRDELALEQCTGIPLRVCAMCRSVLAFSLTDELAETLPAH
ncbi:MAG TPA: hypothetical protein VFZ66_09200 [Herpetosiphonaceae bacterium]